ncbi:hypothetical protein ACFL0X_01095 [Nanoarchaeota archaeon]
MQEFFKILIGIVFLLVGVFLGEVLARVTKEELKSGQKWFRLIIVLSLIGGFVGLIIRNDVLLFSFFFIAIVTSRSLNSVISRKW